MEREKKAWCILCKKAKAKLEGSNSTKNWRRARCKKAEFKVKRLYFHRKGKIKKAQCMNAEVKLECSSSVEKTMHSVLYVRRHKAVAKL